MKADYFDFSKVKNFEKHIELSIPNFLTLDNIFLAVCKQFAHPESTVIDLGCSTGRFLNKLPKTEGTRYVGVDTVKFEEQKKGFIFEQNDIEVALDDYKEENVSVIVGMFMLQFLGNAKRKRVLNQLKHYIDRGTQVLLSEKVYLSDSQLQTLIHRLHIQEKRKGFTDKEILDKDDQLSVSMYCKSEHELDVELNDIGFPTKVWQSYNFMGYVVNKHQGRAGHGK